MTTTMMTISSVILIIMTSSTRPMTTVVKGDSEKSILPGATSTAGLAIKVLVEEQQVTEVGVLGVTLI